MVLIKVSSVLCVSPKHLRKMSLPLESSPYKTSPHPAETLSLGRWPRHELSSWGRVNYSYYLIYYESNSQTTYSRAPVGVWAQVESGAGATTHHG